MDTCGVHNLHRMPGLLSGILAVFVVRGIAKAQLSRIVITVLLALINGILAGYLIRAAGSKWMVYEDADELDGVA